MWGRKWCASCGRCENYTGPFGNSVDEKFVYLFYNARDFMPEQEIWLVIGGDGYRDAALQWLKREAAKVTHKTILVLSQAEARVRIKEVTQRASAA